MPVVARSGTGSPPPPAGCADPECEQSTIRKPQITSTRGKGRPSAKPSLVASISFARTRTCCGLLQLKYAVRWIAVLAAVLAESAGGVSAQSSTAIYEVKKDIIRIPMKDGVRLSALLFRPANAPAGAKFPAIFTYDPYRVNYSEEDCGVRYFVARGYVGACVEIRGTGRSEGHAPPREYSQQELSDGEEVIAWLASQPWSSGSVGIVGLSWSGFNGLRLAMRRPPALKAVISAASTEALYNELLDRDFGRIRMVRSRAYAPA